MLPTYKYEYTVAASVSTLHNLPSTSQFTGGSAPFATTKVWTPEFLNGYYTVSIVRYIVAISHWKWFTLPLGLHWTSQTCRFAIAVLSTQPWSGARTCTCYHQMVAAKITLITYVINLLAVVLELTLRPSNLVCGVYKSAF